MAQLASVYTWIAESTTEAELCEKMRDRLHFGEEMLVLVRKTAVLRACVPEQERVLCEQFTRHCETVARSGVEQAEGQRALVGQLCEQLQTQHTQTVGVLVEAKEGMERASRDVRSATSVWSARMCNASSKGARGEDMVEEAMVCHFPRMSVVRTGHLASSGDLRLEKTGLSEPWCGEVLVEVKCYGDVTGGKSTSKTVPTSEVEKFQRDVHRSKLPLAIMGALGSGIAKKGQLEFERRGRSLLLYMPHTTPVGMAVGVMALQELHRWEAERGSDVDCTQAHAQLLKRLRVVIDTVQQELEHNTFFVDTENQLQNMETLVRGLRAQMEGHRERLLELSNVARSCIGAEVDAASALLEAGGTHVSMEREEQLRILLDMLNDVLSPALRRKHMAAVLQLRDALQLLSLGLRRVAGADHLHVCHVCHGRNVTHTVAILQYKKRSVVLSDAQQHATLQLTTDSSPHIEQWLRIWDSSSWSGSGSGSGPHQ